MAGCWQGESLQLTSVGHPAGGGLPAGGKDKLFLQKSHSSGSHSSPWLSYVPGSIRVKAKPTVATGRDCKGVGGGHDTRMPRPPGPRSGSCLNKPARMPLAHGPDGEVCASGSSPILSHPP